MINAGIALFLSPYPPPRLPLLTSDQLCAFKDPTPARLRPLMHTLLYIRTKDDEGRWGYPLAVSPKALERYIHVGGSWEKALLPWGSLEVISA